MHRLILAALTLLAACAPAPTPTEALRRDGTPMYSNATFDPARLKGKWVQVAELAPAGARPCSAGGLTISDVRGSAFTVDADLCLAGLPAGYAGPGQISGPGRIRLTAADPEGLGAEWWVLWVDADYRTMAIGTPSGRFGMILNRTADLPADRYKAAREILDWNGYNTARLRPVG